MTELERLRSEINLANDVLDRIDQQILRLDLVALIIEKRISEATERLNAKAAVRNGL